MTNRDLRELYRDLDIAAGITNKKLEWIVRMDHRRLLKENLRLKWREEEEREDLDWDGWKI